MNSDLQEKRDATFATMLAWSLFLITTVLYCSNFLTAPSWAPATFQMALENVHSLLVFAPFVFAGFGLLGTYLMKTLGLFDGLKAWQTLVLILLMWNPLFDIWAFNQITKLTSLTAQVEKEKNE